jgi:hypothetical protein
MSSTSPAPFGENSLDVIRIASHSQAEDEIEDARECVARHHDRWPTQRGGDERARRLRARPILSLPRSWTKYDRKSDGRKDRPHKSDNGLSCDWQRQVEATVVEKDDVPTLINCRCLERT